MAAAVARRRLRPALAALAGQALAAMRTAMAAAVVVARAALTTPGLLAATLALQLTMVVVAAAEQAQVAL